MSTFSVSYDLTTKIISAVVCVPLLLMALAFHSAFIGGLAFCVVGLAYAYSPRGYIVSGQSITVKRLVGNVNIPLQGVREARITTPDDLGFCVRLWGSGGLFGYYGRFSTAKLGRCTWYVTDRKNMVVVRTAAKTALSVRTTLTDSSLRLGRSVLCHLIRPANRSAKKGNPVSRHCGLEPRSPSE